MRGLGLLVDDSPGSGPEHENLEAKIEAIRLGQHQPASAHILGEAIRRTPGVCGGDACIRNSRIPVWVLVRFGQLGASTDDLRTMYPTLSKDDLVAAWQYYLQNQQEIDDALAAQEQED